MIRVVFFFIFIAAISYGLSLLADKPGQLILNWGGYEIQTSMFVATVFLSLLVVGILVLWTLFRQLVKTPAAISGFFNTRRQKRGLEALSSGIIAVGAGDKSVASRYVALAKKSLPNEPMTALLRAQVAQMKGDRTTARRIFEAMLESPDTELLGLRGLFLEAQKENEIEAAKQFAERAMKLNPKLPWSLDALFEIQTRMGDWTGALKTLDAAFQQKHITRAVSDRRRAVLLTAKAMAFEDTEIDKALDFAIEAHRLAPELIPAAAIAGRIFASQGNTSRAVKIITRTWKQSPHPELAMAYAYARPGDSPKDRLKRVETLADLTPHSIEGRIAVALTAIEAHEWDAAREAISRYTKDQPSARLCTLMARIEAGQYGDKGRVREWLARGLRAPKDPAWTADGYVSEHWLPVSPVTGEFDVFEWKIPSETVDHGDAQFRIEDFLAVEAPLAAGGMLAGESSQASGGDVFSADRGEQAETLPVPVSVSGKPDEENIDENIEDVEEAVRNTPGEHYDEDDMPAAATRKRENVKTPDTPAPDTPAKDEVAVAAARTEEPQTGRVKDTKTPGEETSATSAEKQPERKSSPKEDLLPAKKPKIFVPPRAPDDPGPEPGEPDDAPTPLARYRMTTIKAD